MRFSIVLELQRASRRLVRAPGLSSSVIVLIAFSIGGVAPAALKRMVMMQTLRLTMVGVAAGFLLAWLLSSMPQGLLYELSPLEPFVMLGALILLIGVVIMAGWLPTRRAARIHPVEALRIG